MRKIRGTSTLKTDMLFLLIAVSYLILSAASFENKEDSLATSGKEIDTIERVKILVSSTGTFETAIRRKSMSVFKVDVPLIFRINASPENVDYKEPPHMVYTRTYKCGRNRKRKR